MSDPVRTLTLVPRFISWPDAEGEVVRIPLSRITRWWHDPQSALTYVVQDGDELPMGFPDRPGGACLDEAICGAFYDCTPQDLDFLPVVS